MSRGGYDMTDLLTLITAERAEGLSLHAGERPVVQLHGEPHPVEGPSITPKNAETLLRSLATTRQVREFREHGMAEFIFGTRRSSEFRRGCSMTRFSWSYRDWRPNPCSETGHRALVAIVASRGPGR